MIPRRCRWAGIYQAFSLRWNDIKRNKLTNMDDIYNFAMIFKNYDYLYSRICKKQKLWKE